MTPTDPSPADLLAEAVEALEKIADDTDPDNPESYRCDDREGCLDAVQAAARATLTRIKESRNG